LFSFVFLKTYIEKLDPNSIMLDQIQGGGGGNSKTAFVQQVVVSPWYRTLYILFYRIPNTVAKVKLKQAQRLENLYLILNLNFLHVT
jgi:hypothetical protein